MSDVSATGLLGLAMRARKCSSGDDVMKSIQKQKAKLVIISQECGDNTKKKLLDKCAFYHVPYVFMENDALNKAIGTLNRKAIAILDEGFAQKLHACLKG